MVTGSFMPTKHALLHHESSTLTRQYKRRHQYVFYTHQNNIALERKQHNKEPGDLWEKVNKTENSSPIKKK